jgi:hypothetical protein
MESLVINTGTKTIPIERDGQNVGSISFNPLDLAFVDRFQALYSDLKSKESEYRARADELDKNTALDENNMPMNANERMGYLLEVCEYMRGRIDNVFGVGTSQTVFGDTMKFEVIEQFLSGVTPFINKARNDKVSQYTTLESAKRNKVTKKRQRTK